MVRSAITVVLAAILLSVRNRRRAGSSRPGLGTWQMDVARSDQEHAFHGQRLHHQAIPRAASLRLDAQWTDQTGRTQYVSRGPCVSTGAVPAPAAAIAPHNPWFRLAGTAAS